MGLAVFINYEKELSKLTDDIYLKEISPFAWGWEYSYEDKQEFTGWKAIQKCYAHVKKKITLFRWWMYCSRLQKNTWWLVLSSSGRKLFI